MANHRILQLPNRSKIQPLIPALQQLIMTRKKTYLVIGKLENAPKVTQQFSELHLPSSGIRREQRWPQASRQVSGPLAKEFPAERASASAQSPAKVQESCRRLSRRESGGYQLP